jgi:alpha/beta superfamily hydrolase
VRSPAVAVAGEIGATVTGPGGGPALEARVHAPAGAARAVVICHPHPLYGGSMHSPVPLVIAKALSEAAAQRVAWARFNFRGVGESGGDFDGGRGEVDDALAVVSFLGSHAPGAALTLCGHSFGSAVALRAAVRHGRIDRLLLIAPSARLFELSGPWGALPPRIAIFIGDHDEFCDVDDARDLARQLGAEIRVFEGYDHHFLKSRRALAQSALPFIAPEAVQT